MRISHLISKINEILAHQPRQPSEKDGESAYNSALPRSASAGANRGDRTQRGGITLWVRPSPRMAANAVCEAADEETLAYAKLKSPANRDTFVTNSVAVFR